MLKKNKKIISFLPSNLAKSSSYESSTQNNLQVVAIKKAKKIFDVCQKC
jgi:hypothetical protein